MGIPSGPRITVDDPDVAARVALWASVPDELGASGMTAAGLARRVLESADRSVEPLRAAHEREIETLTAAAKEMGERGLPGRKEMQEQYQREERRFRTDALRAGLGVLARTYRGRVAASAAGGAVGVGDEEVRSAVAAVGLITETAEALPRNPNEALLLQSLFVGWRRWRRGPRVGARRRSRTKHRPLLGLRSVRWASGRDRGESRPHARGADLQRDDASPGRDPAPTWAGSRSGSSARSSWRGTAGPSTSGA